MLALPYRILIAVGYAVLGGFLLMWFEFTPWYPACWIYFCILLGWALAGIRFDPFRFGSPFVPRPAGRLGQILQRWPVLVLALLLLLPFIAWATRFWLFLSMPSWNEAPYWASRELLLASSFAVCVRLIWPSLAPGRQLCLLLALLLTSHVFLILTYAGISGTPEYLQDGETQDCLLNLFRFKLAVGILAFVGQEIWDRKRVRWDA